MKKLFLVLLTFPFFHTASAQFTKGEANMGLGISMGNTHSNITGSGSNSSSTNQFNLSLVPDFGYFVSDKWMIGAGIEFITSTNKSVDISASGTATTTTNLHSVGLTPFARRYYKIGDKFALFAQMSLSVAFGGGKSETVVGGSSSSSDEPTSTDLVLGFAPGVNYALNERWILEAGTSLLSLGFNTLKYPSGTDNQTQSNLQFSLIPSSINLGIKIILHK
ncbi:MAG TPA: outer membrane beta-barrel protein [Bacteroidia bacterium]|jgi:hypothetical protein|nr:outer membrane beta-barrel protein [Bacteroidia bacterium]